MAPSAARSCSTHWLCIPSRTPGHDPRTTGASQVPRPLSRYALSPSTPESRTGALACVFPARAGFTISERLAALSLRFEAVPGSLSLRLAPCASQGFRAPVTRLTLPARLHVSQAFHMVNSFQFTREVRLSLTHQRRGGTERKAGPAGSSALCILRRRDLGAPAGAYLCPRARGRSSSRQG